MKDFLKIAAGIAAIFLALHACGRMEDKSMDSARDEGYKEGYEEGYNAGYNEAEEEGSYYWEEEGYSTGAQEGYEEGYGYGYDDGYTAGVEAAYKAMEAGVDIRGYDIRWREVDSSAFSRIGYDKNKNVLAVEFHNTGVFYYFDVPEDEYTSFRDADSMGSYYNDHIKGQYEEGR